MLTQIQELQYAVGQKVLRDTVARLLPSDSEEEAAGDGGAALNLTESLV